MKPEPGEPERRAQHERLDQRVAVAERRDDEQPAGSHGRNEPAGQRLARAAVGGRLALGLCGVVLAGAGRRRGEVGRGALDQRAAQDLALCHQHEHEQRRVAARHVADVGGVRPHALQRLADDKEAPEGQRAHAELVQRQRLWRRQRVGKEQQQCHDYHRRGAQPTDKDACCRHAKQRQFACRAQQRRQQAGNCHCGALTAAGEQRVLGVHVLAVVEERAVADPERPERDKQPGVERTREERLVERRLVRRVAVRAELHEGASVAPAVDAVAVRAQRDAPVAQRRRLAPVEPERGGEQREHGVGLQLTPEGAVCDSGDAGRQRKQRDDEVDGAVLEAVEVKAEPLHGAASHCCRRCAFLCRGRRRAASASVGV